MQFFIKWNLKIKKSKKALKGITEILKLKIELEKLFAENIRGKLVIIMQNETMKDLC